MAVDIKSLRIGCHVEYEGKRVRLDRIDSSEIDNECAGILSWDFDYLDLYKKPRPIKSCPSFDERIQPIPITPELLKELGFEWRKDSSCWLRYHNYDGVRYDWGIYAYGCDGGTWCFSLYLPDFRIKPQLYANDLHELEGQLAYYGIELILD